MLKKGYPRVTLARLADDDAVFVAPRPQSQRLEPAAERALLLRKSRPPPSDGAANFLS